MTKEPDRTNSHSPVAIDTADAHTF